MKKDKIREWADKTLKKEDLSDDKDSFLELTILGSLLYSINESGVKIRIKRLSRDVNFEIKPVEVVRGKIKL